MELTSRSGGVDGGGEDPTINEQAKNICQKCKKYYGKINVWKGNKECQGEGVFLFYMEGSGKFSLP